jgi:hypothetical protein
MYRCHGGVESPEIHAKQTKFGIKMKIKIKHMFDALFV